MSIISKYNSNYDKTINFTNAGKVFNLAQNSSQTYTVPGNPTDQYSARFSFNATSNVFVGINSAPTLPAAGSSEDANEAEYRPLHQRYVKGGDVIYFITPDASAYCGVSLRLLP